MTIITDAATAESLMDKYITKAPLSITVIARAEDRFSPETVKTLLNMEAEIITAPKDISLPFVFGLAAGKSNGRAGTVYILSEDAEIRKAAELMGFNTALQKKTSSGKTKAPKAKVKMTPDTVKSGEKPAQTRTRRKKMDTDTVDAVKRENEPKLSQKKAAPSTNETPKKKPAPKPEQVYTDNSETADSKPSAEFVKALTKAGIGKGDTQGVWNAVTKSSASIVYDMQLRLNLLDKDKAKDIYEKTRDMFDELKKMTY